MPLSPTPAVQSDRSIVVAAFDFDGTLTKGDTLLPFLLQGLGWVRFAWVMGQCSPWLLGFALRLVPNHVAKRRLLHAAFAGRSVQDVEGWTTQWLAALPSHLRPDAMAQLAGHQRAGHRCVLVSASPDVYLQRAARQLGFDALICTEMSVDRSRGVLTGQLCTPNCHGKEKVVRLTQWFNTQGLPRSSITLHAYGDTTGDHPMLWLADHAWYRGQPWRPRGVA